MATETVTAHADAERRVYAALVPQTKPDSPPEAGP
jgi:hypothetical protein